MFSNNVSELEICCFSSPRIYLYVLAHNLKTKALIKNVKTWGPSPWHTLTNSLPYDIHVCKTCKHFHRETAFRVSIHNAFNRKRELLQRFFSMSFWHANHGLTGKLQFCWKICYDRFSANSSFQYILVKNKPSKIKESKAKYVENPRSISRLIFSLVKICVNTAWLILWFQR